jgi:hypothetical protein
MYMKQTSSVCRNEPEPSMLATVICVEQCTSYVLHNSVEDVVCLGLPFALSEALQFSLQTIVDREWCSTFQIRPHLSCADSQVGHVWLFNGGSLCRGRVCGCGDFRRCMHAGVSPRAQPLHILQTWQSKLGAADEPPRAPSAVHHQGTPACLRGSFHRGRSC